MKAAWRTLRVLVGAAIWIWVSLLLPLGYGRQAVLDLCR